MAANGVLIAGIAAPGAGKSALFSRLGTLVPNSYCFTEPEEKAWGDAVRNRELSGQFTGVHWFRSERVPKLYQARALAKRGNVVFFDSFYDKLCSYYLGKPGMEWLLQPDDEYFANFVETARLDLDLLPDADAVVAIRVEEEDWQKMVRGRGRALDAQSDLLNTFRTQEYFISAAATYCDQRGAKLIEFHNRYGNVDHSANLLLKELTSRGVL